MGGEFVVRLVALALIALVLGACATQPKNQVYVGVDSEAPQPALARDYAALYAPYAMMATLAYTDPSGLDDAQHCPSFDKLGHAPPGESEREAEFRSTVRRWITDLNNHGWQCRFGVYGSLKCPRRLGPGCKPVSGLEFHIWRRMTKERCEAVIAFRGTDKDDLGDWISNFRWLQRLAPKFDQYAQIQTHITGITWHIISHGCSGAGAHIVSVGHSLGGGLAQQAAYADGNASIRYVYGFDPSPVTGFFDVSAILRERSTRGLGIDRAFEAGEILALPRLLIENIVPPSACHPRIRVVRFNVLTGLWVTQHNMEQLTKELRVAAAKPGANPHRVEDLRKAQACTGPPLIVPPA